MVAVLALDQTGNFAFLQSLGSIVELVYHLTLGEGIALGILCFACILVLLGQQRVKVLAVVQAIQNSLCFLLCFLIGAGGLAGGRILSQNEDVLCSDVVVIEILLQLVIARNTYAVLAEVVILQHLCACADILVVIVVVHVKADRSQALQISVLAAKLLRILLVCRNNVLLLAVRQGQAQLIHLLLNDMDQSDLLLCGLLCGIAECRCHILLRETVHSVHLLIIDDLAHHIACILICVDFLAVNRHNDRCIAFQLLIIHHKGGCAVCGCAHNDSQHNDQRNDALH